MNGHNPRKVFLRGDEPLFGFPEQNNGGQQRAPSHQEILLTAAPYSL